MKKPISQLMMPFSPSRRRHPSLSRAFMTSVKTKAFVGETQHNCKKRLIMLAQTKELAKAVTMVVVSAMMHLIPILVSARLVSRQAKP